MDGLCSTWQETILTLCTTALYFSAERGKLFNPARLYSPEFQGARNRSIEFLLKADKSNQASLYFQTVFFLSLYTTEITTVTAKNKDNKVISGSTSDIPTFRKKTS